MAIAVQLGGTAADGAALAILADAASYLSEETWTLALDLTGRDSFLTCAKLDEALAQVLVRRGLTLVRLREADEVLIAAPWGEGPELRLLRWRRRTAPRLIEALRPLRTPGESIADEALFVMRPDSPGPRRLLERLLLLDRGDAQVCSFEVADDRAAMFAVRVKAPPVYLLMAARDGEDDIAVYARSGASPLWVAWSYQHPLEGVAIAGLTRAGQTALVDRDGAWLRAAATWQARPIHDAISPALEGERVELRSLMPDVRFRVNIRLAPGPVADADLWLLTAEQLLDLEPLIDASTSDELGRLTVARLAAGDGEGDVVYLLRERVRPGSPRMSVRVSETLELPGYVAVVGADNLYIPSGRRLVPVLRRDDLRTLLGLDRAHTVILTEDRDGPRIVAIAALDEVPLQRWIDYVATDRRLELDRLLERSVFEWPEATIAWPEVQHPAPQRPPPREGKGRQPVKRSKPVVIDAPPEEATLDAEQASHLRALRGRVRELEKGLIVGGCDEVAPWQELGEIRAELGELDEAADCLELAIVYSGPPCDPELAGLLLHALRSSGEASDDRITELVLADRRTPAQASGLAAMLLARLAAGRPPPDELVQLALPIFADPRLAISRRLAWSVLAAWHHHARDRLGITRAKEAILGGINERGLSELHDLPRFIRHALAREGDEEDAELRGDRQHHGQMVVLETLWHEATAEGIADVDANANFLRLIFAIGFARLGARGLAQEIVAPIELEIDVHEVPNRALFRLYTARLAHESSGSSAEAWAADAARIIEGVRDERPRQAVQWLQRRSMWLRSEPGEESLVGRPTRFVLAPGVDVAGLAEALAREVAPSSRNFDYMMAEAVDVCVRRALASGSEAVVAEVLASAEPGLAQISILSHRAEAIAACIHGAAALGDDAAVGRLLDELVDIARSKHLGSVRELARAATRGLVALRRFGGLEPARALLDALAGVQPHTSSDRVHLLATVATGFVQLGETRTADGVLDRLCTSVFDGSLDYVTRAQAGLAVAGALRHWPNVARVERFRRFMAELGVFRDTFTVSRYYDTHRIQMLEAIVDSLADNRTRQSDRVQGFLDQEEHALRRRIVTDWSAICGR